MLSCCTLFKCSADPQNLNCRIISKNLWVFNSTPYQLLDTGNVLLSVLRSVMAFLPIANFVLFVKNSNLNVYFRLPWEMPPNIKRTYGGSTKTNFGSAPSSRGPFFFVFMQFSRKFGQVLGWHPLWNWVPLRNPGSATENYQVKTVFFVELHKNFCIVKVWNVTVCEMDSDLDGKTNGEELGDPNCVFQKGAFPQRNTSLSHPGLFFCLIS